MINEPTLTFEVRDRKVVAVYDVETTAGLHSPEILQKLKVFVTEDGKVERLIGYTKIEQPKSNDEKFNRIMSCE